MNRTNISHLCKPLFKQIFSHQIHTIKIVRNNCIFSQFFVIKIQKYHRHICMFLHKMNIFPADFPHYNQSIHSMLFLNSRKDEILLHIPLQYFHCSHAILISSNQSKLLIHFPVKSSICSQISLRNNNTDIVQTAFVAFTLGCCRHLMITQLICHLLDFLPHLITNALIAGQSIMNSYSADSYLCGNISHSYFSHYIICPFLSLYSVTFTK